MENLSSTDLQENFDESLVAGDRMCSPASMIVVYETNGACSYLEYYPIENGQPGNGRPLPKEILSNIIQSLKDNDNSIIGGIIPENMLFYSTKGSTVTSIWYRKPQATILHFHNDLKIPSEKINLPGLIFKVNDKELFVYAYKQFLNERTILYRAPFHNLYESNKICLGTAFPKYPDKTYYGFMKAWEIAFFNSVFTHLIDKSPITKRENLNVIFQNIVNTDQKFPLDVLVNTKMKLRSLYEKS